MVYGAHIVMDKVNIKQFVIYAASIIAAVYATIPVMWQIVSPHVDTYIIERAASHDTLMYHDIAKQMHVEIKDVPIELGYVVREHQTTMAMFDSLAPYKSYLDYAMQVVPEAVGWVDGRCYWYTGKRDPQGKPMRYRVHITAHNGGRYRYWIDDNGKQHYIYAANID